MNSRLIATAALTAAIFLVALAPGCANARSGEINWQDVHLVLFEADRTAEDISLSLDPADPLVERIQIVREQIEPVLALVAARAAGGDSDPGPAIHELLEITRDRIMAIDDVQKRRTGLAILAGVRVALLSAGLPVGLEPTTRPASPPLIEPTVGEMPGEGQRSGDRTDQSDPTDPSDSPDPRFLTSLSPPRWYTPWWVDFTWRGIHVQTAPTRQAADDGRRGPPLRCRLAYRREVV